MATKLSKNRPRSSTGKTASARRRALRALLRPGRREFLRKFASVGGALAVPPLLANCAGDDGNPSEAPADGPGSGFETKTVFFNLAHEAHAGKSYFLEAAGQSYRLTPVSDEPEVLAAARTGNSFLRAVPDDQITHHVKNVQLPTGSTVLSYVGADLDKSAGTWTMSGVYLQVPASAVAVAHERAVARGTSEMPGASARRKRYGLPAATSAQELQDESVLLDPAAHAASLIGLHPELMGLEPTASATVLNNHVAGSIGAVLLSNRIVALGAAAPQQTPGQPNASGWATLRPIIPPQGTPARIIIGPDAGRLQYSTELHPDIAALAGKAMVAVTPQVKNDATLGGDITSGSAPNGGLGLLWLRRDGRANVDETAGAGISAQDVSMVLSQQSPQSGLDTAVTQAQGAGGSVQVTAKFANWYLRYLGAHMQFLDDQEPPKVIPLDSIPEYKSGTILQDPPNHVYGVGLVDTVDTMFVTMVKPISTIMGIPVEGQGGAGTASMTLTVPRTAHRVRLLAGGLGAGSNNYPETLAAAAGMTSVFNYGFTAIFAAAGVASALSQLDKEVAVVLNALATELATDLADQISGNDWMTAKFWLDQAYTLAKYMLGFAGKALLGQIVASIVEDLTVAVVEKAIPVAGLIMAAVSAAIGAADLIMTSVDIAKSPWTYVNDLVFSYDLSVSLAHDSKNGTFPADADSYTVTAMFDDGTPHVQRFSIPSRGPSTLPPVVFAGVPLGGNVNVSAAFSQSANASGQDDILLGKGTTGLVPNTGTAQAITIEQIQFPIGPTTTYRHQQKTVVDDNNQHLWVSAPAPTTTAALAPCGGAGTICAFRSISVRQATASAQGYLGYAWRSWNSDASRAPSCNGGAVGQLDQLANLNTDSSNGGANAQNGYANVSCGINLPGVRIAYSLLSHPASNFYLDTSVANAPVIRQVALGATPQFDSPLSNRAWGVLNMASDSLLLHPSGHLVSINTTNNKVETHRLPSTPATDSGAKLSLLAQVKGGQGSRPGLIDSPVAVAISADGVLLILEAGNNRIQAFDLGANPIQHFRKQPAPYFLTLDQTAPADGWQHLDMAIEFTGFIYVLSMNQNSNLYQMNIYHPSQSGTGPVATATTMNAARLTVDFWRSVYTLNYEVIQHSNPANPSPVPLTEPSVSLWEPCNVGQSC